MYAAEKGQLAVMDVLIKAGAALDVQSTCDNTALICAAVRGHNEAVDRRRHRPARRPPPAPAARSRPRVTAPPGGSGDEEAATSGVLTRARFIVCVICSLLVGLCSLRNGIAS
jgi:ankyrin repeat protein